MAGCGSRQVRYRTGGGSGYTVLMTDPKPDPAVHAEPDESLPPVAPQTEDEALPPQHRDPQDAAKAQEEAQTDG